MAAIDGINNLIKEIKYGPKWDGVKPNESISRIFSLVKSYKKN